MPRKLVIEYNGIKGVREIAEAMNVSYYSLRYFQNDLGYPIDIAVSKAKKK